jgi:hypothetical protein
MLSGTQKYLSLLVVCAFLFLNSCTNPETTNSNSNQSNPEVIQENAIVTKDDAMELATIIKLPFELDDAVWYEAEIEGSGKKLRAFILFYKEDEAAFMSQPNKAKPLEYIEFDLEKWFPGEMVAQSDIAGDQKLKGLVYPADEFFNETYKKGRLVRVEGTDFFLLELTNY